MSQQAAQIPAKGFGSLRGSDFIKAFVKSSGGLILAIGMKALQVKHFPSYDQIEPLLEAALFFVVSYLGFNGATNNVGQMFKRDKPVVIVDKEHLEELQNKADQVT